MIGLLRCDACRTDYSPSYVEECGDDGRCPDCAGSLYELTEEDEEMRRREDASPPPPLRIQRRRTKGWRMPPNTISVCRPGPWGNPYRPGPAIRDDYCSIPALTAADCARLYGKALQLRLAGQHGQWMREQLAPLRGRNLTCWCRLCPAHADGKPLGQPCSDCAPCHADPLGLIVAELRCEAISEAADG